MRQNILKQKWQRKKPALCAWLAAGCPITAEIYARARYDAICIDLQHGLFGFSEALSILQSIPDTGVTPIVRVADHNPALMQKVLDAGAYGIICPMINNAEECKNFIRSAKYPPLGIRSYGPNRAIFSAGSDYVAEANKEIVLFAMVETKTSLQNLDSIVAVEGLDGLFIGPADLSMSLEACISQPLSQRVMSAIEHIINTCQSHGKYVGIACPDISTAKYFWTEGCQLISIANSLRFLRKAVDDFFVEWENGISEF